MIRTVCGFRNMNTGRSPRMLLSKDCRLGIRGIWFRWGRPPIQHACRDAHDLAVLNDRENRRVGLHRHIP